jgi:YidC/Oxa1 family membrane protein insertase
MRDDNRNLLLAIVLSVAVLLGWNVFFAPPTPPRTPATTAQPSGGTATPTGAPSPSQAGGPSVPVPGTLPAPGGAASAAVSREAALAATPRVAVDTPTIRGSINLRGGRIDDVALKNFRETVDPRSPNIVLFSPAGSQNPYYADFGWVGGQPGAAGPRHGLDRRRHTRSTPRRP